MRRTYNNKLTVFFTYVTIMILVATTSLIIVSGIVVGEVNYNHIYTDPEGDVISASTGEIVTGYEDIDIISIASEESGDYVILSMVVVGVINAVDIYSFKLIIDDEQSTIDYCGSWTYMGWGDAEVYGNTLTITISKATIGATTKFDFATAIATNYTANVYDSVECVAEVVDTDDDDEVESETEVKITMPKVNQLKLEQTAILTGKDAAELRRAMDTPMPPIGGFEGYTGGDGNGEVTSTEVEAYEDWLETTMKEGTDEEEAEEEPMIDYNRATNKSWTVEIRGAEGSVSSTEPITMEVAVVNTYIIKKTPDHIITFPPMDEEKPKSFEFVAARNYIIDETTLPPELHEFLYDDKTGFKIEGKEEMAKIDFTTKLEFKIIASGVVEPEEETRGWWTIPTFELNILFIALILITIVIILGSSKKNNRHD